MLHYNNIINFLDCDETPLPKLHQIDCIESNRKVIKVTTSTATKWEQVAQDYIVITIIIIEHIKRDNHYQTVRCCCKIFELWLDGEGRQPATWPWKALIIALEEADFSELVSDSQKLIDH